MSRNLAFYATWVVASGLSSMVAWIVTIRFFSSTFVHFLFENGYVAFAVGVTGAVAAVALSQWVLLRRAQERTSLLLWVIAMQVGFWSGLPFALFGAFATVGPVQALWFIGYSRESQWLLWPANVFLGSGLFSGIPAGLLSGPLHRWALGRGSLGLWIAVSMCAWLAAFGVAGLCFAAVTFPSAFGIRPSLMHAIPTATAGVAGGLAALAHAAVIGLYLVRVLDEKPTSAERPARSAEDRPGAQGS